MKNIKKILAPTDFSQNSLAGLRYALELARIFDAEVTVYYVLWLDEFVRYEVDRLRPAALDMVLEKSRLELSDFIKRHFADALPEVKLRTEIEVGLPDQNIVAKAARERADLIVISTHGRTGLSHIFMGSVTEKVVRQAPCPVLSIPPEHREKQQTKAAA